MQCPLPGLPLRGGTLSASSHITEFVKKPWNLVGDANYHLLNELENLYWNGIENEIENVLSTLRVWQSPKYSNVALDDESDDFIHGFDTFIDQVDEISREFAETIGDLEDQIQTGKNPPAEKRDYLHALEERAKLYAKDQRSTQLKSEIRRSIEKQEHELPLHRRAKVLLQSIGMLDIEKLIEHRPPLKKWTFSKRPAVPQLQLKTYDKNGFPVLTSLQCSFCKEAIRGCLYRKEPTDSTQGQTSTDSVCEDCYRKLFYENPAFVKQYKHCILNKIITPEIGREICKCYPMPHAPDAVLFPMSKEDYEERHKPSRCGLLQIGELTANAKYNGMRAAMGRREQNGKELIDVQEANDRYDEKVTKKLWQRSEIVEQQTLPGDDKYAVAEAEADEDIPIYLRQYTDKYPFGNVHMALRVGPLVIENGVADTKKGASISLRDVSILQYRKPVQRTKCFALSGGITRQLWCQDKVQEKLKRYKAVMKQVVGSPFTGTLESTTISSFEDSSGLEDSIITDLIAASKESFDDPGLGYQDRAAWLGRLIEPIVKKLKKLIGTHVSVYLQSISLRLLDPKTKLKWSLKSNNCQNFCDALIDRNLFGSLISNYSVNKETLSDHSKLYLLSFVCRPAGYVKPEMRTKIDVPRGLTEEYLLRFRFGRHDDADIIDTLQEYWHDWGAFGKHLYKYQDLFPWDCTEAFGRYPGVCGDCNLAKHAWAFPFDSWSIISLHLSRDRYMYPPTDQEKMTDESWMRNRLLVLCAQEKLINGAKGMACSALFEERTSWLHLQADPAKDRLKLGGIHRAQPFSHYYDQVPREDQVLASYQHYFVASWTPLNFEDQVLEYELLRDGRAILPDLKYAKSFYAMKRIPDWWGVITSGGATLAIADSGFSTADLEIGVGLLGETAKGDSGGAGCASNCGAGCGSSACSTGDGRACGGGTGGSGGGCGGGAGCGGGGGFGDGCGGCGGD